MGVYYEVATLNGVVDSQPYALIRIDTDIVVGNGVQGTVVSLHYTEAEAELAADRAPTEPRHDKA